MNILNFNNKQKFYKILRIAFDSKYKKLIMVVVEQIFMLCGIILELFGIGLIFPALKTHNRSRIS